MIGDLHSILEFIGELLDKGRASSAEKNRDSVLVSIYTLGNKGCQSVTPEQLEGNGGFTKRQIHDAVEMAEEKGWIIDCTTLDGIAWLLRARAIYYVEGLLETRQNPRDSDRNTVADGPPRPTGRAL